MKRAPKAIPAGRGLAAYMGAMADHPHGQTIYEFRQWLLAREQVESSGTPPDLRAALREGMPERERELGRKLLLAGPSAHGEIAKLASARPKARTVRAKVREDLLVSYQLSGLTTKKRLEDATWLRYMMRGTAVDREAFRLEFSKALKASGLDRLPKAPRSNVTGRAA